MWIAALQAILVSSVMKGESAGKNIRRDRRGQRLMRVTNEKELAARLGDLFFALVNLARWKKMDAKSVLRKTNKKFKKRFGL